MMSKHEMGGVAAMARTKGSAALSRRRFLTTAGVAGASLAAGSRLWPAFLRGVDAAPNLKGSGSIVVYYGGGAWGAAQRAAYFAPFQAATGIKVIEGPPQAKVGQVKASITAGAPIYDAVDLNGADLGSFIDEGLLQPIDYKFWDPVDQAAFAPVKTNKYHVPALYFSMVLAYDDRKFNASTAPKRWADLLDAAKFPGKRSLATGDWGPASATYEIALLADGVPMDKLYPLDLDRAFKVLTNMKPSIAKFWESGAEPVQLLDQGEVTMASAWNGRVSDLKAKGGHVANSWEQGILQWDSWAVPKGAKNAKNAMKFIAFASQARNQAVFAEHIAYGPPNGAAYKLLKAGRAAVLPTAPAIRDKQVAQDYAWWWKKTPSGQSYEDYIIGRWEKWVAGK